MERWSVRSHVRAAAVLGAAGGLFLAYQEAFLVAIHSARALLTNRAPRRPTAESAAE